MDFLCNVCGAANRGAEIPGRETPGCVGCGSPVRVRALVAALSMELFGTVLKLPDFPVLKSVRGLGMSDADSYARVLAERFYYRNTFYDRAPRFDVSDPPGGEAGTLDFLLSAEVFEHVRPPVEQSFRQVAALLRPHGVLVMTVPYKPEGVTDEHYPELHDYGTVGLRDGSVLVNRTPAGELQVFENLVFHGGAGSTLEIRCFSEAGLRKALALAGFTSVRVHADDYPQYGIVHREAWSLPIAARLRPPEDGFERFSELAALHAATTDRLKEASSEWERHRQWVAQLQGDLAGAHESIRASQAAVARLEAELGERAGWAQDLDRKLAEQGDRYREIERELTERTRWAQSLEAEVKERTAWAQRLDGELQAANGRARELERLVAERTAWAQGLDRRIEAVERDLQQTRTSLWHRAGRALRIVR